MTKHWAQKRWVDCTLWEKCKSAALWFAFLVGAAGVLVGAFFLNSYRWGAGCP